MTGRILTALWVAVVVAVLAPMPVVAQTDTANWTRPRTPWGDPDLQGVWSFATITPLERPTDLAAKADLTDNEVAQLNLTARTRNDRTPRAGSTGTYNAFWWDRGESIGRTSLIIDPADGRIPPRTPEGQARVEANNDARMRRSAAASWEDRRLAERCIQYRPLPRLPTGYNNHYQIFQTPGFVVLLTEMIHQVRVIPLDGRPHIDSKIRLWNGDSRGHWDGDTLVVETTNFSGQDELPRLGCKPAPGRALHAYRPRASHLGVHGRGCHYLDATVDGRHPVQARRGTPLRVCLPRRQLRDDEHAERLPGSRAGCCRGVRDEGPLRSS